MAATGHVNFIWSIAERLRGAFKQREYGSIILPLTLLRRLDQVLAPTREKVLAEATKYEGRGLNLDPILKRASGQLFYNASQLTLDKVLADPDHVATHLREYIAGFDPVVREIFEAFEFDATIGRLEKADRLYNVLGKFLDPELDLHPDSVPNDAMGDLFEELIRRFSEISNETAGEHFTPREVVRLCAELVLAGDEDLRTTPGIVRTVYDPACGTGGMLSVVDELVRERNEKARLILFGQELNPESWAVCRAEMLVKGQDPSRIFPGSTLSEDGTAGTRFDFMLANPPFGVDWADDYEAVVKEHEQLGDDGRFGAGTPRKSDGALLFLQTMLAKVKPRGAASPSFSMPLRCSQATPAQAKAKFVGGLSRKTGWRPSLPYPSSSSTTPASPHTSGFLPTARRSSGVARSSSSTPARCGSRCRRASAISGADSLFNRLRRYWRAGARSTPRMNACRSTPTALSATGA
jgi:type I restriction enzyme M protein